MIASVKYCSQVQYSASVISHKLSSDNHKVAQIYLSKYHKSICQNTTNLFVKIPQIYLSKYRKSV